MIERLLFKLTVYVLIVVKMNDELAKEMRCRIWAYEELSRYGAHELFFEGFESGIQAAYLAIVDHPGVSDEVKECLKSTFCENALSLEELMGYSEYIDRKKE